VLETAGRPANCAVTAFRPVAAAATVDFLGNRIKELPLEGGKVKLDLAAHEWAEILARW
jgi:hypothetical protein